MNTLKRTLALMAALAMTATAFVGCGEEEKKDDKTSATEAATDAATDAPEETTEAPTIDPSSKSTEVGEVTLGTGGDTFTVAAWNADDVPFIIAQWKGIDFETVKDQLANDEVEGIKFINFGVGGGDAPEKYDQLFAGGGDLDVFFAEADWALRYINDDTKSAPLADLGFSDANFAEIYSYTDEIGKDKNGVRKGVSWQAATGGFVYRADLAKEYLGVETPAQMQELVKDWDTFQATGATLYEKSGGKTSIQATEGGLWQVFQSNRTQAWVVDGKLVMDNAADFYDIAKAMLDNNSLANVPQWDNAWYNAIQDGTALGDFVPTWGLTTTGGGSILENFTSQDEALGKNMAICEGPSGWFWGGSYFGVAPKCDNKTLAKEFIEFYCKNADSMAAYAAETGDFMNNKKVMSEATTSNKYINGQNHYEILVKVLDKLDLSNKLTKYDSVIKAKFNNSVAGYLDGTYATKDDAIAAFKGEVATAFPEIVIE